MFEYNDSYLKTYKRYRDIMNTEILIVLNKVGTQTEEPIFKIKGLPKTRVYIDENGNEKMSSEIVLFIDELSELTSYNLNGEVKFPIKDIKNRVKIVRFNGFSFMANEKNINLFQNIVKFSLENNI